MSIWIWVAIAYLIVFIGFAIAIVREAPKHNAKVEFRHVTVALFWPAWVIWYLWNIAKERFINRG